LHFPTIPVTILSAAFCQHYKKQVVSTAGLRRALRQGGVVEKRREADLHAGGEEVEELQHGGGDAEA
jgi:hypothetical protein